MNMERKNKSTYSPLDQLNLNLIVGLYRSHARINRSSQKLLAEFNLTVAQFGVLEALYHLGSMKIGDIIAKTLSTSGNMTVVIRNLEKDGWIQRCPDPSDGRICLIQLTEKGAQLIATIFPEHLHDVETLLDNLRPEEKQQLLKLLKKLNSIDD